MLRRYALLVLLYLHTGYGVTLAAPTKCSLCRDGYFNEGPLSPTDTAAAAAMQAFSPGGSSRASAHRPAPTINQRDSIASVAAAAPTAAPPPAPAPSRGQVAHLPPSLHGLSAAVPELGRVVSSATTQPQRLRKPQQPVDLDAAVAALFRPPLVQHTVGVVTASAAPSHPASAQGDMDAAAAALFQHPAVQPPALAPTSLAVPLPSSVVVPYATGAATQQRTPLQHGDAGDAVVTVTTPQPSAAAPAWAPVLTAAGSSPGAGTTLPAVSQQQRSLQQHRGAAAASSATALAPSAPAWASVLKPAGNPPWATSTAATSLQQPWEAAPVSSTTAVPSSSPAALTAAISWQQQSLQEEELAIAAAESTAVPPVASAAMTAASSLQQRTLQQVSKVFSMPTYNLCTFCGRGCSTRGPGATSPAQCGKCDCCRDTFGCAV
jgi:hypothetical protein